MDPKALGAKCESCPFAVDGKPVRPVGPEVPKGKPLGVLVGEGPSREDVAYGRPFVGQTGEALDLELADAGLQRSRLMLAHAFQCFPTDWDKKKLRAATECCRPALKHYLDRLTPETPVLCMGQLAWGAVANRWTKLGTGRGFIRRGLEYEEQHGESIGCDDGGDVRDGSTNGEAWADSEGLGEPDVDDD